MNTSIKVHKLILEQPMLHDRKTTSIDAKRYYKHQPQKLLQGKFTLYCR